MSNTLRHPSIEPAHPGALMSEVVEDMAIGKAEMARRLGVARAGLYNVLDERSSLTADLAARFEAVTGTAAALMLKMQADHDLWKAKRKPDIAELIAASVRVAASKKQPQTVQKIGRAADTGVFTTVRRSGQGRSLPLAASRKGKPSKG